MNYPLLSEEQRWELIADAHNKFLAQALMLASSEYLNNSSMVQSQPTNRTKKITIKTGDTIQIVARNNFCSERDIIDLNHLSFPFVDGSTTIKTSGVAVRNQQIYIPYANANIQLSKALTENEQLEQLFYCDLLLSEDKTDQSEDIVIRDNDFVFITGIDALRQSLRTKMKRIAGTFFDNASYGVPDAIGNVSDPVSLRLFKTQLLTSIKSDKRVASVKSITVSFQDNQISVDYTVVAISGVIVNDAGML